MKDMRKLTTKGGTMANKYKFKSISLNNDIMDKVNHLSKVLVSGKKLSHAQTIKFCVQVVDRISQPKIADWKAYYETSSN